MGQYHIKIVNSVIFNFLNLSFKDFLSNIKKWWGFFLILLVLNSIATYLEISSSSQNDKVIYYQLLTVISFIVVEGLTTIHFMERFEKVSFSKEQYAFGAFTYTLYTLAYFAIILFGLVLFIIPFFIFGAFFILGPLIALRETDGNAFKRSYQYVKKRPSIALLLFIALIIPEFLSYLSGLFESESYGYYISNGVLTFFETIITIFILKLIVDYYYSVQGPLKDDGPQIKAEAVSESPIN